MNPHFPTPKGGLHRALRVLLLLLLQHALAPFGTDAQARSRLPSNLDNDTNEAESRPYLTVSGSLPLRFAAAPRPLPIIPPKVAAPAEPIQPQAQTSLSAEPAVATSTPATSSMDAKQSVDAVQSAPTTPTSGKPTLSILPDDTHPSTRAEDFLPFFQFPAGGNVTVVVPASVAKPPAPGQMPVSSATYQQR